MRLRVYLPHSIVVDALTDKISAEAEYGLFTILPRHIDFTAPLEPCILSYFEDGAERFLAIDGGVLVKQGDNVNVSTLHGVEGDDLEHLERRILAAFRELDDHERATRAAVSRMEVDIVQRVFEFREEAP